MSKAPVSAVVSSLNEANLLKGCLKSLSFCEEVIVVDLESTDDTKAIAQRAGAKIVTHKRVPFGEYIHAEMISKVRNQWMLITDPDEVIDPKLANDIILALKDIDASKIGMVRAPMWYYFKNRRLKGTPWGGTTPRRMLLNKDGVHFTNQVHAGIELNDGYDVYNIPFTGHNVVHHYWVRSWKDMMEKHSRYLKFEGESKYLDGQRFRIRRLIGTPVKQFYYSFIQTKGWKDGMLGLWLSCFWAWYNFEALLALKEYQGKNGR